VPTFTQSGSVQFFPKLVDGNLVWSDAVSADTSFASGTGSGQANGYWAGTLTIAAGATSTIDLSALSFSAFGASGSASFVSIKYLAIINQSPNVSALVEPGASNGWSQIGSVTAGKSGVVVIHSPVSGFPVSSTSKTLKITNTSSAVSLTGATTTGSSTVGSLSSTSSLAAGMLVSGTGIPSGTAIASVTNGTTIVLTANATATGTGVALTFQWPAAVVNVYAAGVVA